MKLLRSIHAILGTLLCVLMAMWFLSGFVMIYHSYPRVTKLDQLESQLPILGKLPPAEEMQAGFSSNQFIQSLSLEMQLDKAVFHIRDKESSSTVWADGLKSVPDVNDQFLDKIAMQWNTSPIVRVDTLYEVDQWTLPKKSARIFPLYKYYFDDSDKSQLYISSTSARVYQYTTRSERIWAWLGAIPHWVYFTSLRENQPLWIEFVKWTSGISCIMLALGMVLGVRIFRKSRTRSYKSPYRKRWYNWHYLSGLIFGLISISFAFSGLMSLIDLPDWLKKKPSVEAVKISRKPTELDLSKYILDYRTLIDSIPKIKSIEWAVSYDRPYYRVMQDDKTHLIDATVSEYIQPMQLTTADIKKDITLMHGTANYELALIEEHDDYYFNKNKERVPLPVFRVIIHDDLNTHYYYNPKTLSRSRYDDNTRLKRLLYNGLHSLNFKFLADRPILWNILMYFLMIGGSLLSITGVVLSFKWVCRKSKKQILKIKTKQG